MTNVDIAAQRLKNHHLSHPNLASPGEVVRWFGAVQAQDYLGSLYAIGLRLPQATEQTIEQAVSERSIVRTWSMRGTLHYVAAEDVRWMLPLLARRRLGRNRSIYQKAGLKEADFEKAGKVLQRELKDRNVMTRTEAYEALEASKIRTGPEQRGLHIIGYWAQMGLLCLGPRQGKQTTITLLDNWVPDGRKLEGEEALADLAGRYFTSHGPATLADFGWWAGLSAAEARKGLQAVRRRLVPMIVDGRTYWSAVTADPPREEVPEIHLLPAYDEFSVAYSDRRDLVDPALGKDAGYGLGPSIISEGRMVGRWKRSLERDEAVIELDLLSPLSKKQWAGVEKAAAHYGQFIGLRARIANPGTRPPRGRTVPGTSAEG